MNMKKQLFLFWKIGKYVFERQKYCENAVCKYSMFFSYYFGMSDFFSRRNVSYMQKFYSCFPIYMKEFESLDFEHYKLLVNISDIKRRYFYFRIAIFCRSSVVELNNIIKQDIYGSI